MIIPKEIQKNIVLDLIGQDAADLLVSEEVARQALIKCGTTEEDAKAVIAEVLEDMADRFHRDYIEQGKGPHLKMTIVLPGKPE